MGSKTITSISLIFLIWRVLLLLVEYLAINWIPFKASFPYSDTILAQTGLPQWLWQWGNFDGVHYLTLAQIGYDGFGTQVFFPLYPLLIRIVSLVIPNYLLSGLVISHLAILAGALMFYRLIEREHGKSMAQWSTIFLFFNPVSFYFASVYSESLFFLLLVAAFYFRGLKAAVFGALASATRLVGLLLSPALIMARPRNYWGILVLSGLAGYMVYLGLRFDNPLFFLSAQAAFGNERAFTLSSLVTPPQVLFRYLKIIITTPAGQYGFWVALLELSSFIFGGVILFWLTIRRKVPTSWLIFSWGAILLPTLSGTLSSMPRYLLTIFPLFVGLGAVKNTTLKIGLVGLFILLLALGTALFTRGYWVA